MFRISNIKTPKTQVQLIGRQLKANCRLWEVNRCGVWEISSVCLGSVHMLADHCDNPSNVSDISRDMYPLTYPIWFEVMGHP